MQLEIEAKFLNVDHEDIRSKLKALGAKLEQPMRLMRRVMLDHPDRRYQKNNQEERLRIRDEADKVTITYKKSLNDSPYPIEHEIQVSSFDESRKLLESIGLIEFSFQESKRETWEIENVEVVLDEWPWLKSYIEIEGSSEKAIQEIAKKLGLRWEEAAFGSVDTAYRAEYKKMTDKDSVGYIDELLFEGEMPEYLKVRL